VQNLDLSALPDVESPEAALLQLLESPNIASKRWVFEQYDWLVGTQTVVPPGEGDAAVLRVRGSQKGIALKIDCNSRYCYLHPYRGGQLAVGGGGAQCGVYGRHAPRHHRLPQLRQPPGPEIFYQFEQAVHGIADASEYFGTPVISGNVSFYNESERGAVYPTPTIGMLGVLERAEDALQAGFREAGLAVLLVQPPAWDDPHLGLGGSEYLSVIHGLERGIPPTLLLDAEAQLHRFLVACARQRLVRSAHDISEGGFAVALTESALIGNCGVQVNLPHEAFRWAQGRRDAILFSEAQTRVILPRRTRRFPPFRAWHRRTGWRAIGLAKRAARKWRLLTRASR
jgi:phosphoribosylformylglycinamidine (FGAM) synthase-like enzyme